MEFCAAQPFAFDLTNRRHSDDRQRTAERGRPREQWTFHAAFL